MKTVRVKFAAASPQWTAAHPSAKLGFKLAGNAPVLVIKDVVNVPDATSMAQVVAKMNLATFVRPFAAPFVIEWHDIQEPGVIIRPPKEDTVTLNVRLPQSVHTLLVTAAEDAGRSLNAEIVVACRRWTSGRKGAPATRGA